MAAIADRECSQPGVAIMKLSLQHAMLPWRSIAAVLAVEGQVADSSATATAYVTTAQVRVRLTRVSRLITEIGTAI